MRCAICEKRPAKRFCPAQGEKICAVCCGLERESTIDCLPDCSYLLAAHRYEAEHHPPPAEGDIPYPEIAIPPEFLYERWPLVAEIASAILVFQARNPEVRDPGLLAVLESLAEAYRTLLSGIYFERPPAAPLLHALYLRLTDCLRDFRAGAAARPGFPPLRDRDIFHVLIFLLRLARQHGNGRPLSRAFLEFLREQFRLPAEQSAEAPRIILP